MKAKIWIEEGIIQCCSQLCELDDGCSRAEICKDVEIEIKDVVEDAV